MESYGVAPTYEQIANFIRYSELLDEWINGWVDIEYETVDNTTISYMTEQEVYSPHYILEHSSNYISGDYTFSVFAKAGERKYIKLSSDKFNVFNISATFDLENGIALDGGYIEDVGDGWYRCAITGQVISLSEFNLAIQILDDDQNDEYIGDKKKGLYLYGAQFEESCYPNPDSPPAGYIKTYGAPELGADYCKPFPGSYSMIIDLADGRTDFRLNVDGNGFSIFHKGVITNYPPGGATVENLDSNYPIYITLDDSSHTFSFSGIDNIENINLVNIKNINSFRNSFKSLTRLKTFTCSADTSKVTNLYYAFYNCSSLKSISYFDTSNVTVWSMAWYKCNSLEEFPLLDTSKATNLYYTWRECNSLKSFPLINTSNVTQMNGTWRSCSSLTEFPLIDTSNVHRMTMTWQYDWGLKTFPLLDTSSVTDFTAAWRFCSGLKSFPHINTSTGENFYTTWEGMQNLQTFPQLDVSNGTNFLQAWQNCDSLVTFPHLDFSKGQNFNATWQYCDNLKCIEGTLDFSNLNEGWHTFNCPKLTSPASTGTPVRNGVDGIQGVWTNPNPC